MKSHLFLCLPEGIHGLPSFPTSDPATSPGSEVAAVVGAGGVAAMRQGRKEPGGESGIWVSWDICIYIYIYHIYIIIYIYIIYIYITITTICVCIYIHMYITANSLGYTVTDIPLAGFISRFMGVVTKKRLYPSITPRQSTKMNISRLKNQVVVILKIVNRK